MTTQGILVAADITQEWLLPWWWNHYCRSNTYPVACVDFGLSEEKKRWCQERGIYLSLPIQKDFVAEKEAIDPHLVAQMEDACGNAFWPSRSAWFKKPLACLHSPFDQTVWIDLDCEIRGPLAPLFAYCTQGIALALEDNGDYNAGVIAFAQGNPAIAEWADLALKTSHLFRGDQDVLNALLQKGKYPISTLPSHYNWSLRSPDNPDALILHWHGPHGKSCIAHQLLRENLKEFLNN